MFMPQVKIFGISVNPGPFTLKEHVLATIMSTVNSGSAYAVRVIETSCAPSFLLTRYIDQTDIIAVQRVFYNQTYNFSCKILVIAREKLVLTFEQTNGFLLCPLN